MTDTTEDTTPEQTPEVDTEPTTEPETEPTTDDQPEPETANTEAKKYRLKLRAVETERDQLTEQVTALRTAAIDRLVKDSGVEAKAFWAAGTTLADVLDADGNVDPSKVDAGVELAVETLGVRRLSQPHSPREGAVTNPRSGNSWQGAFAPK